MEAYLLKEIQLQGSVIMSNNKAVNYGGAILLYVNIYICFQGTSATEFGNNTAHFGGSIMLQNKCHICFKGDSTTVFSNNTADHGGAILSYNNSYISFERNSTTEFINNIAKQGGGIYSQYNCSILKQIFIPSLVIILLIMVAQYGLKKLPYIF